MSTPADSLVLEHLRHIRGAVDGMRDDLREVKIRVGHLETEVAQIHTVYASMSNRMDRMDDRIGRIEQRLDLAEA